MDQKSEFEILKIMPDDCLAVKREKGNLQFISKDHGESRAARVERLIWDTCDLHEVSSDFPWILFSLADRPTSLDRCLEIQERIPFYQPCTSDLTDYTYTYPDHYFNDCDHYGVNNYDEYRVKLMAAGIKPNGAKTLGWSGALTSDVRRKFKDLSDAVPDDVISCTTMTWDSNFVSVPAGEYISMKDQVATYKYLIDMEGLGYSPRLKLQFFSFRPIFIVDRPWKEFFYQHLEPWVTHVPVSRDLSDLSDNIRRLDSDPKLQRTICSNMTDFAQTHLTRENSLTLYSAILNRHI